MAMLMMSCWLTIVNPVYQEEDTMMYKLKYVRLRATHETERMRIQSAMTVADIDSIKNFLHGRLRLSEGQIIP